MRLGGCVVRTVLQSSIHGVSYGQVTAGVAGELGDATHLGSLILLRVAEWEKVSDLGTDQAHQLLGVPYVGQNGQRAGEAGCGHSDALTVVVDFGHQLCGTDLTLGVGE